MFYGCSPQKKEDAWDRRNGNLVFSEMTRRALHWASVIFISSVERGGIKTAKPFHQSFGSLYWDDVKESARERKNPRCHEKHNSLLGRNDDDDILRPCWQAEWQDEFILPWQRRWWWRRRRRAELLDWCGVEIRAQMPAGDTKATWRVTVFILQKRQGPPFLPRHTQSAHWTYQKKIQTKACKSVLH